MAYLVQSLVNLRAEIDDRWPDRDRRTDGWLWGNPGYSYGHSPDGKGAVHAIDIDADGVNGDGIVGNIYKDGDVLYYIIWNRAIFGRWNDFKPQYYAGENPHTDHIHIEVYRTWVAENYSGPWNIGTAGDTAPVASGGAIDESWAESDPSPMIHGTATWMMIGGEHGQGFGRLLRQLRG